MADTTLAFNIFARDRASKVFRQVSREADKVDKDTSRLFRNVGPAAESSFASLAASSRQFSALFGSHWLLAISGVTAAIGALPAVAVVAASGVVAAFGGGLAAIGILAAAQSKKVKKAFSGLAAHVVKVMKEISKPFESTLLSIAKFARRTFDRFTPDLRQAFKSMAPVITDFSNQFFTSLEQLRPAIKPVTDAFNTLLTSLGPALPGIMKSITDAVLILSDVVTRNPDLLPKLLGNIAATLPVIARWIDKLAQIYDWMLRNKDSIGQVIEVLKLLTNPITVVTRVVNVLSGAVKVMRDGFDKAKTIVTTAVNGIKNGVSTAFGTAKRIVSDAMGSIVRAVSSKISSVLSTIRGLPGRIRGALGNLGGLLYRAGQQVVQGLINGIRSMLGSLANIASSAAGTIARHLPGSPVKEGPLRVLNNGYAGGQIASMLAGGMAKGLPAVTRAASSLAGAATMTPTASFTGARAGTAATAAAGGGTIHLSLNIGGRNLGKVVIDPLRKEVKSLGGVEAAFA